MMQRLFPRISFDLIYAREEQTLSEWQKELKMALNLAHDHLSLYQLTIEPGTVFAKYEKQGKLSLPDEKLSSELLIATEEMTHQYGMYNYEISNYAKIGAESRHNLAYWRYQDYIGIGPGAHGRITENAVLYATERKKNPKIWLELVQKNGNALIIKEALNSIDKAREMILMGLRLKEGVDSIAFQKKCNMMPKQADEILKNGSLYRVINGTLCCRQKIVDFLPGQRENGNPCIQIILDSEIIRTFSIPIRPFQGWRYLKNTDAPKDLPLSHTNISAELPKKLRKELETLGLIDSIG